MTPRSIALDFVEDELLQRRLHFRLEIGGDTAELRHGRRPVEDEAVGRRTTPALVTDPDLFCLNEIEIGIETRGGFDGEELEMDLNRDLSTLSFPLP